MTDTKEEVKPDALAQQGASKTDIDASQSFEGAPKAPVDTGLTKPDIKEGKDETFSAGDEKAKKPDEKPADPPKQEDKSNERQYATYDDAGAQGAIDVLKEAGVSATEADGFFAKAIEAGDMSIIDWKAIEDRVGPAKKFLIKSGVESYYNTQKALVEQTVAATHTIFGGEQNFAKVREWAQNKEKTDPAFKTNVDAVRELLNEGGKRAEIGARDLLRMYNADKNTTGLHTQKLVTGDATGTVIGTPLTRAEYVAELHKANDRGAKPAEIALIRMRRTAGMQAGI